VTRDGSALEIPYAVTSALLANAFGSFYWTSVLMHWNPWRSVVSAMGLVTAVSWVWEMADTPFPFLVAWAASAALIGVELLKRRAFLTSKAIVLQSGLFKTRRAEYPLREVRKVEYSYPTFGKALGVGDIEILGEGWALSLVAVKQPEQNAQQILALKAAAQ